MEEYVGSYLFSCRVSSAPVTKCQYMPVQYTCSPVDVTIVVHIDNGYLFLSFHKIHVYPRGFTFMRILERFFTFMNGFSRSAHQAQFSYSKTIKKCFKMHAKFTKRHLKRCPILQPQHSQSLLHNHPRPLAFVTPGWNSSTSPRHLDVD